VGNRAQVLAAVHAWWQSVADRYAAAVELPLRQALSGWPGCSRLELAVRLQGRTAAEKDSSHGTSAATA